jgi:peptidoglycan/xylan/chitin deacetylase (PgdA/CDA1 family)
MFSILRRTAASLLNMEPVRAWADGSLFQPLILFFHGVEERLTDERLQVLHSTLADFEPLMRHLKRHFEVISLDELAARRSLGARALRRCVLLTFDEGYENNATIVAPLLHSLELPFTIYLTTSSIGTRDFIPTFVARAALDRTSHPSCTLPHVGETLSLGDESKRGRAVSIVTSALKTLPVHKGNELVAALRALLPDAQWTEIEDEFRSERFMTWDQVRQVQRAGATIGSHGHEHYPLHAQQSREEIQHQLNTSRALITEHTGSCRHYCFPNGQPADIGPQALAEVVKAGAITATTTVPGSLLASECELLLPRSCVYTVEELQRCVWRSRVDGSARFLRTWQTDMMRRARVADGRT